MQTPDGNILRFIQPLIATAGDFEWFLEVIDEASEPGRRLELVETPLVPPAR